MAEIPSYLQPNVAPIAPAANTTTDASTPHVDMSDAAQPAEHVYDVRHGATISIPHAEMEVAVRSGLYAPLKDKEYVVLDSDGNSHAVDGTNLKQSLDEGNTYASPEQSHAHLTQRKYGNSEVLAGLEGFNRGALPGMADKLTMGSKDFQGQPITQTDLAGRSEANPISATVGELAGTIFSPLNKVLMPGAAAVEAATAKTLTKVATKAGLTNKVAQAIVAKVIPAAAGSAVEGAYFGAAHLLNEDALGTAQFNAENLMASVEQGALWGAAFGGGLSAAGIGAKAVGTAVAESGAGKYVSKATTNILGTTEKAAREFLGIKPSLARKMADTDPAFMSDAIKWTQEVLTENPSATIADVATKAASDKAVVGAKISKIYKQTDEFAAEHGTDLVAKKAYIKNQIANEIETKVLPQFKGIEGVDAEIRTIKKLIDKTIESSRNVEGSYTTEQIHEMMMNVQKQINFDKPLTGTTLKQEMLRAQRNVLRNQLDSMVTLAEKDAPDALKGLLTDLRASNRRFRTITSLEKAVTAQADNVSMASSIRKSDVVATAFGGYFGGPLGVAGVVGKKFLESDMLRKMQILGKIEKFQQATQTALTTGFKAIGKVADKAEPLVVKSLVDSAVATELVDGKKRKPTSEQQAYRNILANAKFASENPEQFMQGVNKYSSHLYAVAPKTSGALDTTALNAMVFLHSKAPQQTKSKGFFDAAKHSKASGVEMLKMQQRMDMIQAPSKAIKLLGKGKLGASHVETIKAVYPEMYGEMQKQAMNFLSSKDGLKLTYSQKLNMATLLDVQADESTHYSSVLGLQANFSAEGGSGAVSTTQGGLAKLNKASRMDTDGTNDEV